MADSRIVFPLDFADPARALDFAGLLKDHVALFKVGLELFIQAGPQMVSQVRAMGRAGLFLDLKLHDIPTTVNRAMARIAAMGATFATVHACGSKEMLEAAVDGAKGRGHGFGGHPAHQRGRRQGRGSGYGP